MNYLAAGTNDFIQIGLAAVYPVTASPVTDGNFLVVTQNNTASAQAGVTVFDLSKPLAWLQPALPGGSPGLGADNDYCHSGYFQWDPLYGITDIRWRQDRSVQPGRPLRKDNCTAIIHAITTDSNGAALGRFRLFITDYQGQSADRRIQRRHRHRRRALPNPVSTVLT